MVPSPGRKEEDRYSGIDVNINCNKYSVQFNLHETIYKIRRDAWIVE